MRGSIAANTVIETFWLPAALVLGDGAEASSEAPGRTGTRHLRRGRHGSLGSIEAMRLRRLMRRQRRASAPPAAIDLPN